MAQKLEDSEIVSFKELLMANSIQVDALAQLFIEKGFITKEEFFDKLKQVQAEYQKKSNEDTRQYSNGQSQNTEGLYYSDFNREMRNQNYPLILRRFLNDRIELVSTNAESLTFVACVNHTKSKWGEDVIIYEIELGKGNAVRPADLRRFIHDNEKIKELITTCIQDNVKILSFYPWSQTLKDRMESHLKQALGDLSSIFDVESVECSSEGARILVTAQGVEKDGSLGSYGVSFMPLTEDDDEQ
jgi:hypothetical protein